jgi:quercetin dioxygenase-like cupin family protein
MTMAIAMGKTGAPVAADLPAAAYPFHRKVLPSPGGAFSTGLVFDNKAFAVMAIAQPAGSEMPDVNVDKEGDRVLMMIEGDLSLQIGDKRFRLGPGDAVQIPRGEPFGKSRSNGGARLLLIRGKTMRSFSVYR